MNKDTILRIIPECYIDTTFVEALLASLNLLYRGVNHQKGCNVVANKMEKNFSDDFALGVIDDDKRKPSYIKTFDTIAQTKHLRVMKHKERNHFFIVISPAMEMFILDCVADQALQMKDFDLPSKLEEFTEVTKSVTSKQDPRFRKLFKELREHQEVKRFKDLLSYLLDNVYSPDCEKIADIFGGKEDDGIS